jgi:RNA polymerase sigma factor (TIGR02999 family)
VTADDLPSLLEAADRGDPDARRELPTVIYRELRQLARSRMARLAPGQTLQPTALVNEACLRLVGREDLDWSNRRHFFFAAARAMHDILVDNARRKASLKRGGDRTRKDGEKLSLSVEAPPEEILALEEALSRLARSGCCTSRSAQTGHTPHAPSRFNKSCTSIMASALVSAGQVVSQQSRLKLLPPPSMNACPSDSPGKFPQNAVSITVVSPKTRYIPPPSKEEFLLNVQLVTVMEGVIYKPPPLTAAKFDSNTQPSRLPPL